MTKRNDAPVLIISLLVTLGLLGVGGWWLARQLGVGGMITGESSPDMVSSSGDGDSSTSTSPASTAGSGQGIGDRLSTGKTSLIAEATDPQKQAALRAFQDGDYATAISELETYLQTNRNDPEALIYLNNARIGNQQAYTIAVSVPAATSVNPAKEILRGVAQAQQEMNQAGGISSTPLRVKIASDDNDPAIATQIAQALVQDNAVLGVIGHFGSETTLRAAEVYNQGQLPLISPTSTSVRISDAGDYIFRTVPSDRFTATTLSRYLVNQLGVQRAVIYYNADSDYSQSLKNEFTTALYADGGQIVSEINLADPGFDAASSLSQAIQQGAEAIVLASNTATLDQAIQVITANNGRLAVLGGDSLYNPKLLQDGGDAANGMVVAVPWILLANPQAAFAQASRQLWGGDVNWRTAMAYDATMALGEAIAQNPTRSGVQQALASPGFQVDGATGTVQFLPSGDRNQAMQMVEVEPGSRTGYGYDFVPAQ